MRRYPVLSPGGRPIGMAAIVAADSGLVLDGAPVLEPVTGPERQARRR
jgi:hypothetical protein